MGRSRCWLSGARVWLILLSCAALLALAACDSSVNPTPGAVPAGETATAGGPGGGDLGGPETPGSDTLTQIANPITSTPVPTPVGIDASARSAIYAQVVDALLGERLPPVVYLAPYVGEGERLDDPNENEPLPAGLIEALVKLTPGEKYELLDFAQAIGSLDDGGVVKNSGVFITLGAVAADPGDSSAVKVRGSWYRKVGEARGMSFSLQPDSASQGDWKVVSSTQEWAD